VRSHQCRHVVERLSVRVRLVVARSFPGVEITALTGNDYYAIVERICRPKDAEQLKPAWRRHRVFARGSLIKTVTTLSAQRTKNSGGVDPPVTPYPVQCHRRRI